MLHRFGKGRKGRVFPQFNGLEALEERRLLAAPEILDLPFAPLVPAGKSLILPLRANDADGDALSYQFASSSPNMTVKTHVGNPHLRLTVEGFGVIEIEMLRDVAPKTVDTILGLVQAGFYDGLTFHRVISNFMIQGGDPMGTGSGGPGFKFDDEFHRDALFTGRYQLAMANSGDDTNGSQFFITDSVPRHLDLNHTIFGQVVRGESLIPAIAAVPKDGSNKPITPVVITKAEVVQNISDKVVTLKASQAGVYTLTVSVSDGTSTVNRNFTITSSIDNWNTPAFLHPVPNMTTGVGEPIQFQVSATDIDSSQPYFSGTVLNTGTGVHGTLTQGSEWSPIFTFTPNAGYSGPVDVRVAVWQSTDQQGNNVWDTQVVRIAVGDQPINAVARPLAAMPGQPTTFSVGNFTHAGSGGPYTANINWGDGKMSAGTVTPSGGGYVISGTNTYTNPGSYPVVVSITSPGGARTVIETSTVVFNPSAIHATATEGQPGTFHTGMLPNTTGAVAAVDWGDGSPLTSLPLTAQGGFALAHAYPDNGVYLATIYVGDNHGTHPARYLRIDVQNAAPSVTVTHVTSATEGQPITIHFAGVDAAADVAAGFTYIINWNDGSPEQTVNGVTSATHVYATRGTYNVSIRARDKENAIGAATIQPVHVWAAGFTPHTPVVSALQGQASALRVAAFTHTPASGTYTAQINWGDGRTSAGTVSPAPNGGYVVLGANTFAAAGLHTVTVTISDHVGLVGSVSTMVNVVNPGVAQVLANEGAPMSYAGVVPPGTLSAAIDYGDGAVALAVDGNGGFALDRIFADNGIHVAPITVADAYGTYVVHYLTIAVQNVAPTAAILAGSPEALLGTWQAVYFSAFDPSSADVASGLSMLIDWNDGSPVEVAPASVGVAWHRYSRPGVYNVTVRAMDKDGAVSDVQSHVLSVRAVEVIRDPGDAKKSALLVMGTDGDDRIIIAPVAGGAFRVAYNGVSMGNHKFTGRILVYGNAGNDIITINAKITRTAELHGGDGNDSLTGGSGPDILVGGAGNDVLKGGAGRNLLIGGLGRDTIVGGKHEDLIIAGRYKFETKSASLAKALNDWNGSLLVRAATFSKQTVVDDKAADVLTGGAGTDRFFARTTRAVKDTIRDLRADEQVFEL